MNARRYGFTLVEILVVIAIIAVMFAMLLPAIQASREVGRRARCQQNVARLLNALQGYESAYESLPPGTSNPQGPIRSEPKGMHHSWITRVAMQLGLPNVARQIDFDVSVYDERHARLRATMLPELACPSEPEVGLVGSNYAGCHHDVEAPIDADNHGVLFLNSRVRMDDISDGPAHTIFVGEKIIDADDLGWMSGTRATLRNAGGGLNAPLAAANGKAQQAGALLRVGGFGSHHAGGLVVMGFGDGSVESVGDQIDSTVLRQLAHRADGQPLGIPD